MRSGGRGCIHHGHADQGLRPSENKETYRDVADFSEWTAVENSILQDVVGADPHGDGTQQSEQRLQVDEHGVTACGRIHIDLGEPRFA